jgi:hypothetical protein
VRPCSRYEFRTLDSAPASLVLATKKRCSRTSDGLTEAMLRAPDDWGGEYASP